MKTMHRLILAALAAFTLCLGARAANEGKTWMVVDLRTGALSYYGYDLATATNTFNTTEYKTEKMVFRRIPQGDYDVPIGDTPMAHIPTRSYVAHMPRNYYLAIFPVTIAQWEIIKDASSTLDQIGLPQYVHNTFNTYHWCKISDYREPQVRVSFEEIVSGKEGQEESALSAFRNTRGVRLELPTTAMWEVAMWARSIGDTSPYTRWFFGNGEEDYSEGPKYGDLRSYAWIKHDPVVHADYLEGGNAPHHPVGQLLPNAWGFYDMLGNCYEWSSDYACPTDMDAHNQHAFNPFDHDFHANSETNLHIQQELYEYARCLGYDSQEPDVPLHNQAYNFTYTLGATKYNLVNDFRSRYMRTVSKSQEGMFTVGFRLAYVCTDEPGLDDEYTITWNDYDGTTLHWKRARYNSTPEYTWDPPVRPEDDRYSYTFAGWSPATVGPAVSNATYTATYIATPHVFHSVRWLNHDGTELFAGEVRDGFLPQYGGETPARSSDAQYHYNFSGWTPNVAAVYGDKTYTAVFDSLLRSYDVTWFDEDGVTELVTTNVPYGSMPEYLGTPPSKASTVQLTYSFAGWSPVLEPVTSNAAYTAVFDASPREYTISWRKWDGTELFTTNVPYGSTPVYLGATPAQPSTAQYDYVFNGWNGEIAPVTGAATYYAMFMGVLRSYDITWANYDGTALCVTNVPYGATPAYNGATPTKPPTATTQFVFSGWTETVVPVTEPATYTAAYAETPRPYPVTWLDYDGTVLCVTNVPCGETPTYPGETLKRPGYFFNGWTPAVEAVTGEAAYTASYRNMEQDSDGYYLLGSVQDWQGFATLVEATPTANARMIADIDLGDDQTHIGSMYESSSGGSDYSVYYKGIFDGQGHTLTVAYDAPAGQISAPFTKIQGALVKNLHVAGTIHAASAYIGVVGMTSGDNCISNVWMSADITRPQSGWLFSASILGYFDRGTVTIVDCLYTGSSVGGGERYMGCFVGGTRDYYATVRIRNCLSVGTFDRGSGMSSSGHANCYVKQFPTDIPAEMQVTDEQLADGTTATALQAGREEPVWVQDAEMGHPMLKMFGKKETAVTVGGSAVGAVVRGEDGKTLSFAVAAGTVAGDVKLDIGGVDVTKGFRVTVNGTEARAVLLAPYEVPKEEGAADGIWTENGDGTVTLNVTVVPGLYYAADSAASLDALACPGASAPATGATTLTAPKPVGGKGFFRVWVSDAPIPAEP